MKAIIITAIIAGIILLTGCSHNPAIIALGEHSQIGFGPPETSAGWRHTKGLFVLKMGRENERFILTTDSNNGVNFDETTGTLTGVSRIEYSTGPQVTGYLVDLARENPELAKLYLEAVLANQKTEQQLPQGAKASGE